MNPSSRRSAARALACAAIALVPLTALATPASAEAFDITFDCQADAPIVGPQQTTLTQGTDITAPATVAPGGAFDVVIDPTATTVPANVNGFTVKQIKDVALQIPIPANSTFVSADLTGGSGLGSEPSIDVEGSVATLSFAGPVAGGAEFELPTVTAHLTAGESGTIETKLGGTSYEDPGLTLTTVVNQLVDIEAPTACFPDPSPVFTTTTIG
ncbi:cyclase [Amycolatopsis antarctica]|uniref:Cyclase n=1 Tax=Amycolatopsis antarctica TaxID=1854586 RepID=A0A263D8E6_9PSEU|nr:cyclase [Amycolatopsis antarctica]OZM74278.1 cyclase [Amycolatopsis antarctica]